MNGLALAKGLSRPYQNAEFQEVPPRLKTSLDTARRSDGCGDLSNNLWTSSTVLQLLVLLLSLGFAAISHAKPVAVQPGVTITKPADGATFKSGKSVALVARATSLNGVITRVDYYEGASRIASASPPHFHTAWKNPPPGSHEIFAVAIDMLGVTNASDPVQITIIPANDNFTAASHLTGSNVSVVGIMDGTTLENEEPDWNGGGPSVWYAWKAPAHGRVHLAMTDWPNGTYFGAFTGTKISNLKLVADNLTPDGGWSSGFFFEVQAGATYHIVVAGAGEAVGPFRLHLNFLPKPANDDFSRRAPFPGRRGTASVDNFLATFERGEPSDLPPSAEGESASLQTVWWTWTTHVAGQVNIQPSCDFKYLLGLYSGNRLSNLRTIAKVFNGGATLDVAAGTTYQISVDGASGQTGLVNMNVGFTPRPRNDDFTNGILAVGAGTTLQGNNTAATLESGEPQHAGMSGGRSVWWTWVAPDSGFVTLTPALNSASLVVAVYTGVVVSNLTSVAASSSEAVGFHAVAGNTYHIAVESISDWQGSFTLNLLLSTIHLTSPLPSALFYVGDPIVLSAATTYVDGIGATVDFFNGTEFLGSASQPNATIILTNAGLGTYDLTASITDGQGIARHSEPVQIRVRPANDDFTNSFMLEGLNVTTNGSNLGAGKEPGEPAGADSSADASVWYSWTAPVSGVAVASIQESYFVGHPLGVYVGDAVSNLVVLGENIYDFYPIGFVAHAGSTYYIAVSGSSQNIPNGAGPFGLSINQTPAPSNDDFVNRVTLSGASVESTGSNIGATAEPGEPGEDPSVWWSWTAPGTGTLYLTATSDTLGAVFSFFTGNSVSNLQSVGSIGPSWYYATGASGELHVYEGTTYQIRLSGSYTRPSGEVKFDLNFASAPANDNLANGYLLMGSTAVSGSSNNRASVEAGEPNSNGRTVWWRWKAPTSGPVSLGTSGSSFEPLLSVFTGTKFTNLALVTNGLSRLIFNAQAGREYQISADANNGGQVGQIQLTLVAGLPGNDAFNNRISLSGTNVTTVGSSVGATRELLEPVHGNFLGSNSVWWTWTPTAKGTLTVTVTGDGFNPIWAVYSGSSLGSLSLLADSYVWPWSVRSSFSFPVQRGIPLQIAVDGAVEAGGGPAGIIKLSLSFTGLPSNDDFANRTPLAGTSTHVNANTSGATREPGEPNHAGYSGGHSIWWSWTAPTSGYVTLDASGSALTTLAGIYTGNTVSNLTNITSGNASFAPLSFDCDAGVTYQIALDHWYSDVFGAVNLNLVFSSVRLTSLTNEAVFHAPSELSLAATNTVWDGIITQMDFLADGNVIGSATNAPYAFIWNNPPLGDHAMQARALDSNGSSHLSPSVVIHVRPANDDFADRILINGDNAVMHASGINATLEPGEPSHGPVNWESVWWSWIAPADGRVTISKTADFNYRYVLLDVYAGAALPGLVRVTNTPANGNGTLALSITFKVYQGVAYQIAVAGSFFDRDDVPVSFSFASSAPSMSTAKISADATLAATMPFLSQPQRVSPTQFSFILNGAAGLNYSILASSNLSLPASDWDTIMTTNLSENSATIQDNAATNSQRIYRVKAGL